MLKRVTRRISSSLFPENIGPQMTSTHPPVLRLNIKCEANK